MGELLDARDGAGTGAAKAHLTACEACRAELDRLHQHAAALRALPALSAPRDRWPVVRAAMVDRRRRARWARSGWAALAAAAVLVGIVTIKGPPDRPDRSDAATALELEALVQESRELEDLLHTYQPSGRVVSGLTAATIADLEDRIAVVDRGIERARAVSAEPAAVTDLWRERVTLMDQLVATHVRQVGYVGF
jgi:predicted anti-sigma-YlaC factor YlaD